MSTIKTKPTNESSHHGPSNEPSRTTKSTDIDSILKHAQKIQLSGVPHEPVIGLRCSHCRWETTDHIGQLGNDCPECDEGRMERWPPEYPTDYASRKARFAELVSDLENQELEVAETKSELAALEKTLLEDMSEIGERRYTMQGRTFHMKQELIVNKGEGVGREALCDAMVACGFGDLVHTMRDYSRLKARIGEMFKAGEEVPEQLASLLYIERPIRLRNQKAPQND